MKHQIHIAVTPNEPIDLDRFVAALLALASARVEAEREAGEDKTPARGDDE